MTKTPKSAPADKPARSAIGREVAKLLLGKSVLSYEAIAERVRKRVPDAHTTPRSVASVASALRAAGHDVPDRRRHAAA